LFDNVGDVIAISSGFFVSVLPGFLLGMWLGGDAPGAGRMQLTGAMVSCFAFFPIVLLSILDTGSIFQPISAPVVRSIKEAAEAWGGYYLKTLVAFFLVMIIWFVLLGKTPVLSAVAGCMLPLLLFFMCQQIGALAESVGEHLSFEFSSPEETTSSDERSKLKDD
jgi:hypothetical protein